MRQSKACLHLCIQYAIKIKCGTVHRLDVQVEFQFVHLKMECAKYNVDLRILDKANIAITATTNSPVAWNVTWKEYRAQNVLLAKKCRMTVIVWIAQETRTVMMEQNAKKGTNIA